jgi:hypothetical protein
MGEVFPQLSYTSSRTKGLYVHPERLMFAMPIYSSSDMSSAPGAVGRVFHKREGMRTKGDGSE